MVTFCLLNTISLKSHFKIYFFKIFFSRERPNRSHVHFKLLFHHLMISRCFSPSIANVPKEILLVLKASFLNISTLAINFVSTYMITCYNIIDRKIFFLMFNYTFHFKFLLQYQCYIYTDKEIIV